MTKHTQRATWEQWSRYTAEETLAGLESLWLSADKPIEDVRRRPLNTPVYSVDLPIGVQCPAPTHCPGCEYPCPTWSLVDGGVSVI